jgi:dTDP-4-dehydrorhamnose reductase
VGGLTAAVLGANGQLGTDVSDALERAGYDVVRLTHAEVELGDEASVHRVLGELRPDVVVNTAAMHNVEACELDPAAAHRVNGQGTRSLALHCAETGAYLVQISTDYVFDGSQHRPYLETDVPRPLNVYGNSKLSGEHYALTVAETAAVLRVSGLYGVNRCRAKDGLNFVQLMLKLAAERDELRVVDDEVLTPTPTADVAEQVVRLCESRVPGLFHGTAHGECSWYRFAEEVFALAGVKVRLLPARPGEFPAKVARPAYSVLANRELDSLGLDVMSDWQIGLKRYLET